MNKPVCWILGMITGGLCVAGAEAIVLAAVPSSTLLNSFGMEIVGQAAGSKGIIPMLLDMKTYTVDDFPVIKVLLDQILAEGGMGDLITLDYEQIKDAKLMDGSLSEKLKNAIKVTATLSSLNVNLGEFGKLDMFKEWKQVDPTTEEVKKNPAIYYYKASDGKYARAYDDQGNPVAGLTGGSKLYLANLNEIVVTELFSNLSVRMHDLTYKDFMVSLMGVSEADLQNDKIYKLIGNKKLSELNTIDSAGFKIMDIVAETQNNKVLFDILEDLTGTARDQITLGQLSDVDIKDAKLTTVLDKTENAKLFSVLKDMTGKEEDALTIADLDGATTSNIKISTVLDDAGNNVILEKLIANNTTIGGLGSAISNLTLNELFGEDCFTTDPSKKVNSDIYYVDGLDYVYTDTLPAGKEAHYVSEDAGVWLVFAFDAKEVSAANGRAGRFSPSVVTFNDLQDDATAFSQSISNSTLYQLISAKIIQDKPYSDDIKALSLSNALALIGA